MVIAPIFGIITWRITIWEELLWWMWFMNGICQLATVIEILVFLLYFYSSTFGLIMRHIWEELLSWMGIMNGIMNGIFLWASYCYSVFTEFLQYYIWADNVQVNLDPWGWPVIPGDSDKGLTDHIGYWHQYFRAFLK